MPEANLPMPACHGLIAAWRLAAGQPPAPLSAMQVTAALAAGEAGLWLHFDLIDARARSFLLALPTLPEAARATLVETDAITRIEAVPGALHGCLPDIHYDAEPGPSPPIGLLHFALTAQILVTARRHPLRGVHLALQAPLVADPSEALAAALHSAIHELGRAIATLGERLAQIEDRLLRPGDVLPRDALAAVRREALRLSRHLDPIMEALEDLEAEAPDALAPLAAPLLREGRRVAALVRALAAIRESSRIAQDQSAALAAEETNRRLLVLSVLSAAMLPASLVAGIFGMNVGGVPGVEQGWGFAMAMALVGASIGGVLLALRLGRML